MDLNQIFNINSFLHSLLHILITKTNYDQLWPIMTNNFKRIEKKIEISSVNPTAAFDYKYIWNKLQHNSKQKILKVHPLNYEKVFNWIETWSELSEWTSK